MSHDSPFIDDGVAPDDVDALVGRVAELQETQLTEDVEAFVALFTPEATWVTGGGVRLVGREEIASFTGQVLPGAFATGSVRYQVQLVRQLATGVVLTGVAQTYLDQDGTPTGRGLPTYIWVRGDDRTWRIGAGQNTSVPD